MVLLGYAESIAAFLVVLTVLVFVHEMGHYLVARFAGVRVETFSIGFGPELFGWYDRAGTRWRVSAIPIGGYVKMFGDADATSMPGEQVAVMTDEEKAVSFHHKPLAARAAVIAAGPLANFLFTIVLLAVMFATIGQPYSPPTIGTVVTGSAAAEAGLQPGDSFVSIDGQTINRFEDVPLAVQLNTGTPMAVVMQRDGAEIPFTITPRVQDRVDRFGNHEKIAMLGVSAAGAAYIQRDPGTAVVEAGRQTWALGTGILRAVGQMIRGTRNTDELGGPIAIVSMSGKVFQSDGLLGLLALMAQISVNLGLINLFPIPVLDGGHLLFYAAEALRGRPLGQRAQEYGFRIGLAIVLTLMVFATWNDLAHLWPFTKV